MGQNAFIDAQPAGNYSRRIELKMNMTNIIEHLGKEAAAYKEFISVLQQETECLVSRDYKGLYEAAGAKEALLSRIQRLMGARAALLKAFAQSLSLEGPAEEAISAMLGSVPPEQKKAFIKNQSIVSNFIDTIKEVSRVNSLVIRNSLEHINKTLGFFGNFMPGVVYKPSGAFGEIPMKGSRLSEGA